MNVRQQNIKQRATRDMAIINASVFRRYEYRVKWLEFITNSMHSWDVIESVQHSLIHSC